MKFLVKFFLIIPFSMFVLFVPTISYRKFEDFCRDVAAVFDLKSFRQKLVIPLVIAKIGLHSGIIKFGKTIEQLAKLATAKKAHKTYARQCLTMA